MTYYDFVKTVDAMKGDKQEFILSPTLWNTFHTSAHLKWKKVHFKRENRGLVPQARGIYVFIVEHSNSTFPPHGYIMYVGQTGDQRSTHTLYKRFLDYLREAKYGTRLKIRYVLNKFSNDLQFCYADIPDRRYKLTKIEDALISALVPWANSALTAEAAPAKAAW